MGGPRTGGTGCVYLYFGLIHFSLLFRDFWCRHLVFPRSFLGRCEQHEEEDGEDESAQASEGL